MLGATHKCSDNEMTGQPDCMTDLRTQLVVVLAVRLLWGNIAELLLPAAKQCVRHAPRV